MSKKTEVTTPTAITPVLHEGFVNTLRDVSRAYRKVKKAMRLLKKSRKSVRDDRITGEAADKIMEDALATLTAHFTSVIDNSYVLTDGGERDLGPVRAEDYAKKICESIRSKPEKEIKVKEPKVPKVKKVKEPKVKTNVTNIGGVTIQVGEDTPSTPLVFIKGGEVTGVTKPNQKKPKVITHAVNMNTTKVVKLVKPITTKK